ncbi:NAD(P)-dependent alcohol dehydrogenase [Acidaminobacter sp. JC074]|uniref:NAD(P)-dependent alcohol dehydrogenase n=1 Tax=Acidaminobacter sp. JC074 TaxID=2530199 RepID=UPI001F0DE7B3|nr:NAD(P)-dependent alcohol dehydrogenase [Acidaminobacter sp. JC074]MCH4889855.1 NAD(P)-dependent alcohol dehydrogenase [Acidaminobacter sp. JC074]
MKSVSHEEAATLALAGVTALQGIRDYGKVKKGSKVLINGASSGVASFAVQIAKDFGAEVSVLCSEEKKDVMFSIGADHIFGYNKISLSDMIGDYDLIYDCATYKPAKDYEHLLSEKGIYIANGGAMKHLFKVMIFGKMMSKKDGITYTNYLAKFSLEDLDFLHTMLVEERLKPLIYKSFDLDEIVNALKTYKSRKSYGKIVVRINKETV